MTMPAVIDEKVLEVVGQHLAEMSFSLRDDGLNLASLGDNPNLDNIFCDALGLDGEVAILHSEFVEKEFAFVSFKTKKNVTCFLPTKGPREGSYLILKWKASFNKDGTVKGFKELTPLSVQTMCNFDGSFVQVSMEDYNLKSGEFSNLKTVGLSYFDKDPVYN